MQIAIFSDTHDERLESEINSWLLNHPEIEVISQALCCGERDSRKDGMITISLLYRVKPAKSPSARRVAA